MVYLDDIVIYSESVEKHEEHVRLVLNLLRKNQLIAKKKKYAFFYKQIGFWGFVIGDGKVKTDPEKISKIVDWPTPKSVKACQSFLGYPASIEDLLKIILKLQIQFWKSLLNTKNGVNDKMKHLNS